VFLVWYLEQETNGCLSQVELVFFSWPVLDMSSSLGGAEMQMDETSHANMASCSPRRTSAAGTGDQYVLAE
jgi:hypothetical protein